MNLRNFITSFEVPKNFIIKFENKEGNEGIKLLIIYLIKLFAEEDVGKPPPIGTWSDPDKTYESTKIHDSIAKEYSRENVVESPYKLYESWLEIKVRTF